MTAQKANDLSKSKIPFLDEILERIEYQAKRGLFKASVNYNLIEKETISELENMGYSISKGGVDNYDYIIDWSNPKK